MSFDFRADQLRVGRIISSGSLPLLIYPSSSAGDLAGSLTSFSTASVGTDVFIYISGSNSKRAVFGGDVRVSGSITGSIRTVDGTNQFLVGSGLTVNYNSTGQFELTGATTAPGGNDSNIQLNNNNIFSGSSDFTYVSGTVGMKTLSGSNSDIDQLTELGSGPGLLVNSNTIVTQSFVWASGLDPGGIGGFVASDKGTFSMFSGSLAEGGPSFSLDPGETPLTVNMSLRGAVEVYSGGIDVHSPLASRPVLIRLISGSSTDPAGFEIVPSSTPNQVNGFLYGSLFVSRLTASIQYASGSTPFMTGRGITTNYNSSGQWELSSSFRQISVAGYSRTNLTSPTVIGYAYINPADHPTGASISIEAVGMNMGGVSGGLSLYNQNDSATAATLSWSGTNTLTTGSYQVASFSMPASARSYELHLSQSGGVSGGTTYTSVGFVNFRIS